MPRRGAKGREQPAGAQQLQLDTDAGDTSGSNRGDSGRAPRAAAGQERPARPAGQRTFQLRPTGLPMYDGYPIIDESEVDGFRLGLISPFADPPMPYGDAFLVAPDDSRCGIVWESEVDKPYVREVIAPDDRRWGVWAVGFKEPLRSEADAAEVLRSLLPSLRLHWQTWAAEQAKHRD